MKRLLISILLAAAAANAATVSLDLNSSILYALPGTNVTFAGTLTNTGPAQAFIAGDSFTFPFVLDDTPFLLGFPPSLMPEGFFSGPVLTVSIPNGTPLGFYSGVFNVLGGDAAGRVDVIGSQQFGVQVVPEPAGWILCVLGLGLLPLARQRAIR